MSLTRDDFLTVPAKRTATKFTFPAEYPAPFGGKDFHVLRLNANERGEVELKFTNKRGVNDRRKLAQARQFYAVACVCDEDATLIFRPEDVKALGPQDGLVMDFVTKAINDVNGVDIDDLEAGAKNSEATHADSSQ